ncbi:MAG TPA: hypothetical protein VMO26_05200 [Vicinamibacterales bacterium]|nr:hypothetical protein [Vicinamibacterales bacterium]
MRSSVRFVPLAFLMVLVASCDSATPLQDDSQEWIDDLPPAVVQTLRQVELAEINRVAAEEVTQNALIDSVANVWKQVKKDYRLGAPGLLQCGPGRYASAVRIVGPDGARINFGKSILDIPPGALADPVVITAEELVSTEVQARLSPHGLQFAQPAQLTIDHSRCKLPPFLTERIVYTDDSLNVLEWLEPIVNQMNSVQTEIDHFSRYAVAF